MQTRWPRISPSLRQAANKHQAHPERHSSALGLVTSTSLLGGVRPTIDCLAWSNVEHTSLWGQSEAFCSDDGHRSTLISMGLLVENLSEMNGDAPNVQQ